MIYYLLFAYALAEYAMVTFDDGASYIVVELGECYDLSDGSGKRMYKQVGSEIRTCFYTDDNCLEGEDCPEWDIVMVDSMSFEIEDFLPTYVFKRSTGESCDDIDPHYFELYTDKCLYDENLEVYMKYSIEKGKVCVKEYSDRNCLHEKTPGAVYSYHYECDVCEEDLSNNGVEEIICNDDGTTEPGDIPPPSTNNNCKFLYMPVFGPLSNIMILNECTESMVEGSYGKMIAIDSKTYAMCEYSNSDCEGNGICMEGDVEEEGMQYISQIPKNIAHFVPAIDSDCDEEIDAMVMIVEDKCIDLGIDGIYMKVVLSDDKLQSKMFSDNACTQAVSGNAGTSDFEVSMMSFECDQCVDVGSYMGGDDFKRALKKDIGSTPYMTVVCEEYSGVSSTIILLMIAFLFLLF